MQPLFYAALAFALGVAAAGCGPAWLAPLGSWWLAAAWAAAAMGWKRHPRAAAALLLGLCCTLGSARAGWSLRHPPAPSRLQSGMAALQPTPRTRVQVVGYLRDAPDLLYENGRASGVRLDLEAVALLAAPGTGAPWPASGGVRLYAYPPSTVAPENDDVPDAAPPPASSAWAAGLMGLHAGDGLAATVHLRPLRSYHDPGVPDVAASARREGIELTATLPVAGWRPWPAVAGPRLARLRAWLWRWLGTDLDRLAPPDQVPSSRVNALLRGMLLGDVARLDEATRTNFQVDGAYHLLVVAGLHIGVLAVFLTWGFRRLRLPRLTGGGLCLLLLAAYAWVIAGRTPTLRALFMLTVYFGARWLYRERQALNAVGAAGLALLAWHPFDLFAPGFQLSFGAATLLAGVAVPLLAATSLPLQRASRQLANLGMDEAFPPKLAQWRLDVRALAVRLGWLWRPLGWRIMPAGLRAALRTFDIAAISLILQVGLVGFNVVYFHRGNPWSVVANVLLVPAAALLIPVAWLGLALAALGSVPARLAGTVVVAIGQALLAAADWMARRPLAGLRVPSPPGWWLVAFGAAACIWLVVCARIRRWQAPLAATAAMAAVAAITLAAPFPPRLPPGLTATVLDVGQGDSILVTFPDRRTLLVDGGPHSQHWDTGEEVVAPFLWSLGLRRLDAVLLTHAHNDHLGGLDTVVADFRPREVWATRTLPQGGPVRAFLAAAAMVGARVRRLDAGENFLAGASELQVLLPPPGYQAGELASNDDSMVVRIRSGRDALLLEGDAEAGGERWMVDHGLDLSSAVLKVGHHGSHTSSTLPFLESVRPKVAVISVGAGNVYGHPSPDVVARLQQLGARVFRTDRDGAVQCRLLGDQLKVYLFPRLPGS